MSDKFDSEPVPDPSRPLAQSEQASLRFEAMANALPLLIAYVDKDERYQFNNKTYETWFGQRAADLKGRTICDLIGQRAYALMKPGIDRVLGGEQFDYETSIPYRGGGTRDVHIHYVPDRNSDGEVVGYYALIEDIGERLRTEAALRESEERLQFALAAADGVGTWDWDVVEDRVYADAAFARLYGVDPAHAKQGAPIADFVAGMHPDDGERVGAEIEHALATGAPYASEYRLIHPDGTLHWVSAQGRAHLDETGQARRFPGVTVDITARRQTEAALRESELRFRSMADHAPVMMWVTDTSGHCQYLNRRWYEFTGQTEEEAHGFGWLDATHPDDRPGAEAAFLEANAVAAPFRVEYRLRRADGGYGWAIDAATPRFDKDGAFAGYVGSVIDIDDRKRAEIRRAALSELSDRLRDLDDPADVSFAAAEVIGKALGVSRAGYGTVDKIAETITIERDWNAPGVTSIAGILNFRDYGSYIEDLKRGDTVVVEDAYVDPRTAPTADALKGIFAQSFVNMPLTEQGDMVALTFLNQAEARQWLPEEVEFLRDAADRTRSAFARRTAERELRDLADSLEQQVEQRTIELRTAEDHLRQSQKMEAIGQLTGGIAHDFNNLLTGIIGSLDMMKRRAARGETVDFDRYTTMAMTSANRAAALTQRLLAFARRQALEPKTINPNRLVAGVEDLIRRSIGEGIRFEIVKGGGLWRARCDPNQLESALLNLAINARDAMPDGGTLTIETCNAHLDDAYAASQREVLPGQYVCIAVTDTGTGMDADVIARAFDPFFTTKPIGQGTGLGLSMIYGFARQSDGYVKIYSEPGQGTTVKLYLPRHLGAEDMEDAVVDQDLHRAEADKTVLLVEDEDAVRALVVDVLGDLGYRTLEAADGPSALRIVNSGTPIDLLVTDVGLPGMNGRQVADAARVTRPDLKILFITGYAHNAAVGNGLLEPGMEVVTKPFAVDALAQRIHAMMERV